MFILFQLHVRFHWFHGLLTTARTLCELIDFCNTHIRYTHVTQCYLYCYYLLLIFVYDVYLKLKLKNLRFMCLLQTYMDRSGTDINKLFRFSPFVFLLTVCLLFIAAVCLLFTAGLLFHFISFIFSHMLLYLLTCFQYIHLLFSQPFNF